MTLFNFAQMRNAENSQLNSNLSLCLCATSPWGAAHSQLYYLPSPVLCAHAAALDVEA